MKGTKRILIKEEQELIEQNSPIMSLNEKETIAFIDFFDKQEIKYHSSVLEGNPLDNVVHFKLKLKKKDFTKYKRDRIGLKWGY